MFALESKPVGLKPKVPEACRLFGSQLLAAFFWKIIFFALILPLKIELFELELNGNSLMDRVLFLFSNLMPISSPFFRPIS